MLTKADLQRCLFAVIELQAAMRRGQFVGVPWTGEMIAKLTTELSSERHSLDDELTSCDHDDRIGSAQVAAMTGWNIKKVQRHYKRLGGKKIGNSIMFRKNVIQEHLAGAE